MVIKIIVAIAFIYSSMASAIEIKTMSQDASLAKFNEKNKERPGICLEIISALMKQDPNLKFTGMGNYGQVGRIEEFLESGEVDVYVGLLKTDEREKKMNFLNPPVFNVKYKFVAEIDDPANIGSVEDVAKLGKEGKIVTTSSSAFEVFLKKHQGLFVDTAPNIKSTMKKLLLKRARFLFNSDLNLTEISDEKEFSGKFKIYPAAIKSEPQYITVSKKLSPEKVEKIKAAIVGIEKNGELSKIRKRYFVD